MTDYQALFQTLAEAGATTWLTELKPRIEHILSNANHGDMARWQQVIASLPELSPSSIDLLNGVRIGTREDLDTNTRLQLIKQLQCLHPWRKGPYDVYGIQIDTEWRSDWKWDRLKDQIHPLHNRLVLDVGCGNGYHGWRMLGAGARAVVGIDPTLLSVMQHEAIHKLHGGNAPVYVLPLGIEDIPADLQLFDTVFSMGVLYHRRSPIDHLLELKACIRPGGQLVLETLVLDKDDSHVLLPEGRYAQMRNVWFIPSCASLASWMRRCGFKNVRLCNAARTTIDEQRSTEWMRFQSLEAFLHPDNDQLTREGHPAPIRAIYLAEVE